MWQGLILWLELAEFFVVGLIITFVGAWGLIGCMRPERAPERDVQAQADEVVASYVKVTRLEWVEVEEPESPDPIP